MGTDNFDSVQWMDLLTEGAAKLSIEITNHQADMFIRHARLLLDWNQKVNLTAITDPAQMAVKHFLDSVAPLVHISKGGEILDLGTGGGFPGIPLKIMRPVQSMTLIDGTRKKINFVKQVIRQLGLTHVEALHQRAEALGAMDQYAGRYTTIVSRAVSDLAQIALLAKPLLAADGKIVVYKGPGEKIPEQLFLEPKGQNRVKAQRFEVTSVTYHLPIFNDPRCVVILKASTP